MHKYESTIEIVVKIVVALVVIVYLSIFGYGVINITKKETGYVKTEGVVHGLELPKCEYVQTLTLLPINYVDTFSEGSRVVVDGSTFYVIRVDTIVQFRFNGELGVGE